MYPIFLKWQCSGTITPAKPFPAGPSAGQAVTHTHSRDLCGHCTFAHTDMAVPSTTQARDIPTPILFAGTEDWTAAEPAWPVPADGLRTAS